MVTLKGHKRCDHQDPENPEARCYRQPSFNFFGSVGGLFCHQHKMPGMVNVVNKCCEHEGCVKRPSFNFPNIRPARFCGQHRIPGMVSTTIGYRIKQQQSVQKKQCNASECGVHYCRQVEGAPSTSPGHTQSSDNSAETEYCPYDRPDEASPQLGHSRAGASIAGAQRTSVDLAVHMKAHSQFAGSEGSDTVTPSTITKSRRRFPAINNPLTISTLPNDAVPPSLDRQASDARTVGKGHGTTHESMKHFKASPSAPAAAGIPNQYSRSSATFGPEHKGMPVSQRVIDACRPSRVQCSGGALALPTANRTDRSTPVKMLKNAGTKRARTDVSDCDDDSFCASDSDDCFSDQVNAAGALLDAFSPVRPRGQLNASDSNDFELEFGWDPVITNAVMKNTFNGFGAIRSH